MRYLNSPNCLPPLPWPPCCRLPIGPAPSVRGGFPTSVWAVRTSFRRGFGGEHRANVLFQVADLARTQGQLAPRAAAGLGPSGRVSSAGRISMFPGGRTTFLCSTGV
jgi:hypothetical protein